MSYLDDEPDVTAKLLGERDSEIVVDDDTDYIPISFVEVLGKGKNIREIQEDVAKRGMEHWKRCLLLAVGILSYLTVGALVMALAEHGWGENRDMLHGYYWAIATMQGIGFGDFVPLSNGTKLFVSFYLFLGVGFTTFAANINTQQDLAWLFDDYRADIKKCKEEIKAHCSLWIARKTNGRLSNAPRSVAVALRS